MANLPVVTMSDSGWNGAEGRHWAEQWQRYDRLVEPYQGLLVAAAAPVPGLLVLDVGCGTGRLGRDLAPMVAPGTVVGIDLSESMLAVARQLAAEAGLANLELTAGDAARHRFAPGRFDLVVSRFGLMFFDEPAAAFAPLARCLRPGGRLVALAWRSLADNEWLARITAACGPAGVPVGPPSGRPGAFGLAEPELTRAWLAEAGFTSIGMLACDAPLDLGPDVDDAFAFVSSLPPVRSLLESNPVAARAEKERLLRALLEGARRPSGVRLGSGAWLITAVAGRNPVP